MEAGKRVLRRAEELIESSQSFTVETTLSGSTYLRMVARAKEAGFLIAVIFVGTDSVDINIERIKARVQKVDTTFLRMISDGVIQGGCKYEEVIAAC